MKLQALTIFLLAFIAGTHAAISPEVYWKIKLPNTQIPRVIKDFLPQTDDGPAELKQDNTNVKEKVYYGLSAYDKEGVAISWLRAATKDEISQFAPPENVIEQVTKATKLYFFLEKELEKGNIINFPDLLNKNEAPFLPRQFVESIPFSIDKFPEILNHLSIDSKSNDAQTIKKAIELCEPGVKHMVKKTCATSLESMVDFGLSVLGTNNIRTITSEVEGETQESQRYTIEQVEQIADGDNMVCHKLDYAYALHYCHFAGNTKTYMVSMVGVDGTKVKAVSVCHEDTSFFNPKSLPFIVLKVKPGTPICHFLKDDQVAFIPSEE